MNIMNLKPQELVILGELTKLAMEAQEAAKLIKESYNQAFGIGSREIHVYHTDRFGEYYGDAYLTIYGVWKYHDNWWGGRDWAVNCSADGIYKCYRAGYLKEIDSLYMIPENERQLAEVTFYFKDFIEKLKEKNK